MGEALLDVSTLVVLDCGTAEVGYGIIGPYSNPGFDGR